jgi:uncharacterized protein involved in cysteine biosynthesis
MTSQVTIVKKRRSRALWPVLGFVLLVALALLAWFLAPGVTDWLKANLRGFSTRGTDPQTVQLMIAALIFLTLAGVTALIVALFAPKKVLNVKETDLVKERKEAKERRELEKRRQRKINREMKNVKRG